MKQLLSIELLKLKRLNSLKIIFLAYMILVPTWMWLWGELMRIEPAIERLLPSRQVFGSFPHVWEYTTYCASFFNILMGVSVVIITCNEIQFRTQKQNVIDGLSKKDVILSKFLVIFALSTAVTIYTSLVAIVSGLILSDSVDLYPNSHYIFIYYLQTLGYFSFAFLLASLIKKSAVAIILFVFIFPLEWIAGRFMSETLYSFFPLNIMGRLTPFPFEGILAVLSKKPHEWIMPQYMTICFAFGLITLFFMTSYLFLRKRDL